MDITGDVLSAGLRPWDGDICLLNASGCAFLGGGKTNKNTKLLFFPLATEKKMLSTEQGFSDLDGDSAREGSYV